MSNEQKRIAGEKAAEYIEDGMSIGLGTGSTVNWTILKLGEMVAGGLSIKAIPTSTQTEKLARENNIPLIDFSETTELDLTIDGADEIDPNLNLIKGGGGALLREKLVAAASKRFIIVADETKLVDKLGAFPLPVEVVPFAWETTEKRIAALGLDPQRRMKDCQPFVSDNGNYILDCRSGSIDDPTKLHVGLKSFVGVVETGLFVGMTDIAIIASQDGIRILEQGTQKPDR